MMLQMSHQFEMKRVMLKANQNLVEQFKLVKEKSWKGLRRAMQEVGGKGRQAERLLGNQKHQNWCLKKYDVSKLAN